MFIEVAFVFCFFLFKQKTAYERRISDWSSDVCSSDLAEEAAAAWYCARDPETSMRVKATLLAALAYFVMPADFIPDFVAVFGFTDDATVLIDRKSVV